MAAKAFVLIQTTSCKAREVINDLKQLEGVKSVDSVAGPYDLIAIIEGENLTDIGDLITSKIQHVSRISRIVTCICLA
ncbi:Lrp/AsnC ligand binding domain-containing protein [Chloroflexota bacterium]